LLPLLQRKEKTFARISKKATNLGGFSFFSRAVYNPHMSHYRDTAVFDAIAGEERRQKNGLELIPSENYVSKDVREASGSVLTNKYSEGYPGRRYYGGQDFTDVVETLAIERACALFGAKFANVQAHSGAPANLAVYSALLEPGDTVLGMDLSHGGHLTHGHPMTLPAKIYKFVTYKMKDPETGEIDYDELRALALEHKPKIILAGFSAYSRTLDYAKFVEVLESASKPTLVRGQSG
jgi:glycine hydroxymethyltransferase